MLAFVSIAQLSDRQLKSHKRLVREASSSTQRNDSFKTKTENRNKTRWTSMFPYFNHPESWAVVLTSVITISLTLRWRLACTSRETVGLRHYHYHPCSKHLYYYLVLPLRSFGVGRECKINLLACGRYTINCGIPPIQTTQIDFAEMARSTLSVSCSTDLVKKVCARASWDWVTGCRRCWRWKLWVAASHAPRMRLVFKSHRPVHREGFFFLTRQIL